MQDGLRHSKPLTPTCYHPSSTCPTTRAPDPGLGASGFKPLLGPDWLVPRLLAGHRMKRRRDTTPARPIRIADRRLSAVGPEVPSAICFTEPVLSVVESPRTLARPSSRSRPTRQKLPDFAQHKESREFGPAQTAVLNERSARDDPVTRGIVAWRKVHGVAEGSWRVGREAQTSYRDADASERALPTSRFRPSPNVLETRASRSPS